MAVEQDDDAMEAYLEGSEPDEETLKRCIRKGAVGLAFVPVLCGSAFKNKGVQPLLDAVVDFLPSPLDVPAVKGVKPNSEDSVTRESADDAPASALAFKIMTDPFVGSLTFVRIYSGVFRSGTQTLNAVKDNRERIGRMLQMHANHREEVKEAYAGDIVALAGLKEHHAPGTPCATRSKSPVILEKHGVPGPGHRGLGRAQDQGRPGEAVASPSAKPGVRKTRPSTVSTDPRERARPS